MPSEHGSKLGMVGQGITDTRQVYILASTYGQVRKLVSYTARAKGRIVSRAHPRQGLFGCLKMKIRAGTSKEQDTISSRWVLGMDTQMIGTVEGMSRIWATRTIDKTVWAAPLIQATWTINRDSLSGTHDMGGLDKKRAQSSSHPFMGA